MYKIIGIDGQEYGPVSADQIRTWIVAGRANSESKIQLEGTTDWKPLSAFPEFADALRAKVEPAATSAGAGGDSATLDTGILARGYTLDAGSCLSRAWEKLMADLWPI